MGHRWIITTLADYLIANQDRTVHLDELVRETQYTPSQILAALNKWKQNRAGEQLRVIVPGRAWRYSDDPPAPSEQDIQPERPPAPAGRNAGDGRVFEHLGATAGGALILRDNNNVLYTAKEM